MYECVADDLLKDVTWEGIVPHEGKAFVFKNVCTWDSDFKWVERITKIKVDGLGQWDHVQSLMVDGWCVQGVQFDFSSDYRPTAAATTPAYSTGVLSCRATIPGTRHPNASPRIQPLYNVRHSILQSYFSGSSLASHCTRVHSWSDFQGQVLLLIGNDTEATAHHQCPTSYGWRLPLDKIFHLLLDRPLVTFPPTLINSWSVHVAPRCLCLLMRTNRDSR